MNRRTFVAQMAALGGGLLLNPKLRAAMATDPFKGNSDPSNIQPGVKLALKVPPMVSDEALTFIRELGVGFARVDFNPEDAETFEEMQTIYDRWKEAGIKIFGSKNRLYQSREIGLGEPGRDEKIEQYCEFIRNLGRLGVPNCEMSWQGWTREIQTFTTGREPVRGIRQRTFDLEEFRKREAETEPEVRISREQMWANYKYLMDACMPVAEEAGVRIAMHPDDPPIAEMSGVARIFNTVSDYEKAHSMYGKNLGVLFCIGTWAEGGKHMEMGISEAIRHFAKQGRLYSFHYRNVSAPLPRFTETFMDEGYVDMQLVVDTIVDVGFNGILYPDHMPHFSLDNNLSIKSESGRGNTPFKPASVTYPIAYMHALLYNARGGSGVA